LYGKGFTEKEKKSYIPLIYSNLGYCIKELAKQSIELPKKDDALANCKVVDTKAKKSLDFILEMKDDGVMSPAIVENVKTLWADVGIQNTFKNSNFLLPDSTDYFLDKIEELAKPTYIPSEQDILRVRVRTTGIVETDLIIDSTEFKMIDVGGQRNERKKWIHYFENVAVVLFVLDISTYDQMLYEDEKVSRLEEALNLFEWVCNSRWFRDTSIVVFMNRCDLFKEKITRVPLTVTFPEYTGENTHEEGIYFLEQEFQKRNRNKQKLIVCIHCYSPTDHNAVMSGIEAVKKIIAHDHFLDSGLV